MFIIVMLTRNVISKRNDCVIKRVLAQCANARELKIIAERDSNISIDNKTRTPMFILLKKYIFLQIYVRCLKFDVL